MKDFDIIKQLGKGAFASVFLVRRKEDKNIYALKRVTIDKLNKKELDNSLNEVRILASIKHINIIGYKEAFFDEQSKTLNIVMEFADDGDLNSKIQKYRKTGSIFPESLIWSYTIQMVQGLKALHDCKIMHRDLKSANIFLMKNGTCKLGDLNVSKVVKMGMLRTQTGTPYYASPEVWNDSPYSYKSDLWSIGIVVYELCALRPPFKGKNMDDLYKNVCRGRYDSINPTVYSKDLADVVKMLLQVDAKKRPNCEEFLENEIVKKYIGCVKGEEEGKMEEMIEGNENKMNLLNTIKVRDIREIKNKLPKMKNYDDYNNENNTDYYKQQQSGSSYHSNAKEKVNQSDNIKNKKAHNIATNKNYSSLEKGKKSKQNKPTRIQSAKVNPPSNHKNQIKNTHNINYNSNPIHSNVHSNNRNINKPPVINNAHQRPKSVKVESRYIHPTPNVKPKLSSKKTIDTKPKRPISSKSHPVKEVKAPESKRRPVTCNPKKKDSKTISSNKSSTPYNSNNINQKINQRPKINNDPDKKMLLNPIKIKEPPLSSNKKTPTLNNNVNYFLKRNIAVSNISPQNKNYNYGSISNRQINLLHS